jgi:ABC-type uncharacterized transport system involved in gliding motility auxiliary subunit
MSAPRDRSFAAGSLIVLLVAFIAAVIASNSLLRGVRLDLTENHLYTLSDGTKSLLGGLSEPINLYFFFSDKSSQDIQVLRDYADRVRDMLHEFVDASNGMLHLQEIDPLPFSEEEDRAAQYGLTDIGQGTVGDSIYFGLAATNSIGDEGVIKVFDPDKEPSLEYDLARLVYTLSTTQKPVVGLISGVQMTGGFDPQTQQMRQAWVIDQHVRQLFDVRNLSTSLENIDDDISLLWIVHPVNLPASTLYAIDQFIMKGGRALIFVDPLAEVASATPDPTGAGANASSTLEPLFKAWGLKFDPTMVVADNRYALSVNVGTGRPVRHLGLIGLDPAAMAQDDIVTADLSNVNLGTAGSLSVDDDADITLDPLLESSTDSELMPAIKFQFLSDPLTLLDSFQSDDQTHILAARIEGTISTAYPDGPPGNDDSLAAPPDGQVDSTDDPHIIVVADVDMLSDRLWVQQQRSIFGQQIATPIASNHDFVANAVANLAGSENLIGLKSRQTYDRPFDRVQELRREADARFREQEQRLQAQLDETENRLSELQSSREDSGSLLLSPEQEAEVERFRDEQLRIRQELRSVQRELDSSIETLGTTLKLINIVVIPLLLALIALAAYLIKRHRRQEQAT